MFQILTANVDPWRCMIIGVGVGVGISNSSILVILA